MRALPLVHDEGILTLAKQVDAELDLRVASEGKGNSRQMFNLGAHLAKKGNMTGEERIASFGYLPPALARFMRACA